MQKFLYRAAMKYGGAYIDQCLKSIFVIIFANAVFQLLIMSLPPTSTGTRKSYKPTLNKTIIASVVSGIYLVLLSLLASQLHDFVSYTPLHYLPYGDKLLILVFLAVITYYTVHFMTMSLKQDELLSVAGIGCELGCSFLFFLNTLLKQAPLTNMGICVTTSFLYLVAMYRLHSDKKL